MRGEEITVETLNSPPWVSRETIEQVAKQLATFKKRSGRKWWKHFQSVRDALYAGWVGVHALEEFIKRRYYLDKFIAENDDDNWLDQILQSCQQSVYSHTPEQLEHRVNLLIPVSMRSLAKMALNGVAQGAIAKATHTKDRRTIGKRIRKLTKEVHERYPLFDDQL